MELPNYDNWKLASPYEDEGDECPQCGEMTLEEDKRERSIECLNEDCDFSDGFDWDAEAERRMEAQWDRDDGRDMW